MLNSGNYQRNARQNYNEAITSHHSEWPTSKSWQIINAGEDVEKRELSYTVGGNATSTATMQMSTVFSLVAQSCPTLCDPMNCSTPGLPVHHQLPEFTQTRVHRVSDAIQLSPPLSSPSPPAPNPSQHQSLPMSQLFAWGSQSTGVSATASFPPKKSQDWSPSEWTGWISLQSKGFSRAFSNTTVQNHQFFGAQPSSQSSSHIQGKANQNHKGISVHTH